MSPHVTYLVCRGGGEKERMVEYKAVLETKQKRAAK